MPIKRESLAIVLLVALLTSYVMAGFAFGRYMLSLLAPDMIADGVLTYAALAWMTSINQVGYLAFSFLGGFLARRVNPKLLIVGSVGLTGLSLCALGVVENVLAIGVLYAFMGVLTATSWVPMVRVVQHRVGRGRHGSVLGIVGSGTAYGTALTGVVVPLINQAQGWAVSWTAFGVVVLALTGLGWVLIPSVRESGGHQGSAAKGAGLANFSRRAVPLYVMMFMSGGGLTAVLTYFVPYLRSDLGFSASFAGYAWSLMGICGMASGILIGMLADRTSVREAIAYGHAVMLAAIALAVFAPGPVSVLVTACVFGLGYYGTFAMFAAYISKMVPARDGSSTYGIGNLCLGLGAAVFNYLGGTLKALTGSFEPLLMASCVLGAIIIVMATRLQSDREEPEPRPAPSCAAAGTGDGMAGDGSSERGA